MTADNPLREKDERQLREIAARYPKLFRSALMPWFNANSWPKMRAAAVDRDKLHETFEDFERVSNTRYNDLTSVGHPVEKVEIDVAALIAWCASEKRPLDSFARQQFAILTLLERDRNAGHA
jgi:hypothetical protein